MKTVQYHHNNPPPALEIGQTVYIKGSKLPMQVHDVFNARPEMPEIGAWMARCQWHEDQYIWTADLPAGALTTQPPSTTKTTFKPGDLVRLKSGGPVMVVTGHRECGTSLGKAPTLCAEVSWEGIKQTAREVIEEPALRKVSWIEKMFIW